jgi:hypothetical protein
MLGPAQTERVRGLTAMVLSLAIGWTVASTFGVPPHLYFEGSLLRDGSPVMSVLAAVIAAVVAGLIGGVIAGRSIVESTVSSAAFALAGFAVRGDGIRYALFTGGASAFYTLCVELLLLFATLFGVWFVGDKLLGRAARNAESSATPAPPTTEAGRQVRDKSREDDEPLDQRALGLAVMVAVMAVLMKFLCASQDKPQVLAAVAISSYLAALCAHQFVPCRPGFWFWLGPLVVGLIGYVSGSFGSAQLDIGLPGGFLAGLARPTPLDYAAAGTIGALVGYRTSLKWHQARHEPKDPATTEGALEA